MYQQMIREETAKMGFMGRYDPRHIEGYMRLEHGTLDNLSANQFRSEIEICMACIDQGGIEASERNARSFGL